MAGKTAILSVRILGDGKDAKKELDNTGKAVGKFKDVAGKAGLASGAALSAGLIGAVNADGAKRKLVASLGTTGPEAQAAGKVAGNLFTSGMGESMEEVNSAVAGVSTTLASLGSNGGADVERLSEKALNLASTFGTDVAAAISTAGIVMKSGLATDADQAFDLIAGSMQKMPEAMREELLPVMDEYSVHFNALGIEGAAAFDMVVKGASNGAIGMDKVGDSLKEFQIRATDMSTTSGEAFKAIGKDQQDMANRLLAGGDTANQAFGEIVTGLSSIQDPSARAAASIALFGTPLEDLGVNGIPDFLAAVNPMNAGLDSMGGKMDEIGKIIGTGPAASFTELQRTATASLVAIGGAALPVLDPILQLLIQFAPVLGPVALAIAGVAAVTYASTAAQAAWTGALVIGRGAVAAATGAQWLWNAAMTANPVGLVIALVVGLIAVVVLAYNKVDWFRDAINGLGPAAQAVFGAINGAIQGTIKWVKDAVGWFGSLFGAKNKANTVSVNTGARMAAPAAMPMGRMALAAPALMSVASYDAPATYARATAPTTFLNRVSTAATAARENATPVVNNNITVNGALDARAVAKQISDILDRFERSKGKAVGGFG